MVFSKLTNGCVMALIDYCQSQFQEINIFICVRASFLKKRFFRRWLIFRTDNDFLSKTPLCNHIQSHQQKYKKTKQNKRQNETKK